MEHRKIGFAFCGSFCTYSQAMEVLERVQSRYGDVLPIVSEAGAATDTRFGAAHDFMREMERICGRRVVDSIAKAEPIGPRHLLDVLVIAPCTGSTLARLANAALGRGLTGLEFAHGIPGTLGGAVVMNAGAYGGEMVQVLTAVTYLDGAGEEHTLPAAACALTYRHSRFSDRPDWLVLEAELELRPGDGEAIRARMDELAAKRREKQPLEWPSGGSTFKRPEGHFAAALIEGCGLKGVGIGGAQVSEKHAGFVVNRGGATADDVRRLMALVQETVLRETGVALEPEVRLLGF